MSNLKNNIKSTFLKSLGKIFLNKRCLNILLDKLLNEKRFSDVVRIFNLFIEHLKLNDKKDGTSRKQLSNENVDPVFKSLYCLVRVFQKELDSLNNIIYLFCSLTTKNNIESLETQKGIVEDLKLFQFYMSAESMIYATLLSLNHVIVVFSELISLLINLLLLFIQN